MFGSLNLNHFRCFRDLTVRPLSRFNLILGRNNVGKTALLEGVYLLVGPTNPELPLRINAFRGIEQFKNDAEDLWGWLFYAKDMEKHIRLSATSETGKPRTLTISMKQPREIPASASKRSPSKQPPATTTTTTPPTELFLRYRDESGSQYHTRAFIKETGLGFDRGKLLQLPTSIFVSARGGYSSENPERLSKLALLPSVWVTFPHFSDFWEHAREHLETQVLLIA